MAALVGGGGTSVSYGPLHTWMISFWGRREINACPLSQLAYQRSVTHAKWSIHVKNCQNRLELSSFQKYLKVIVDSEMSMVQGEEKGQMTSNDDYTTTPLNPIKI